MRCPTVGKDSGASLFRGCQRLQFGPGLKGDPGAQKTLDRRGQDWASGLIGAPHRGKNKKCETKPIATYSFWNDRLDAYLSILCSPYIRIFKEQGWRAAEADHHPSLDPGVKPVRPGRRRVERPSGEDRTGLGGPNVGTNADAADKMSAPRCRNKFLEDQS